MTSRDLAVVLVAAGSGQRLAAGVPKAFALLAGRTILAHAIEPILDAKNLGQLIIAVPQSHLIEATEIANEITKNSDAQLDIVVGGETRQQSIANALAVIADGIDIVLVHDAARAFATTDLFDRVSNSVRETGLATIPALEVADTIKEISGEHVLDTVDRSKLRKAQTPQGFKANELHIAYSAADAEHTDDAALVQAHGLKVRFVAGEEAAQKITTAADFEAAEKKLSDDYRTGIGVDVHRFSEDKSKPLYLGGVLWPNEVGLDGHSDGDAVSHAIVDALLSAAGLGDIGGNFGVDRPEFAGASGQVFLNSTIDMLAAAGFKVVNVSVQIVGNRPKLSPRREEVEIVLTKLIGAPVTLGATTTDGLGFLGNSEGVAAVASALIIRAKGRLTA